ncbi:MAG: hypothetical protein ABI629_02750 [bacterium]
MFAILSCAAAAGAQPRDLGVLALPGLIVEERTLPRAAGGRMADAAIAGVRATGILAPADAARLDALAAQRAEAADAAPGAAFSAVPTLPGDADEPARIDSGDPDPDRLHTAPPPPAP